jgi:hypothetical protein
MPEVNIPPCPTHGAPPRALHTHNFAGIIEVCEGIINTVSGVGTTSFSRCPYGYPSNFEGVVRVLEDLNLTISGIQGGGGGGGSASGIVGGSGIYVNISGDSFIINSAALPVYPGSGITPESSGTGVTAGTVFHVITSGQGSVETGYDGTINVISGAPAPSGGGGGGSEVIVSGDPGDNYGAGSLWFDTNEGRLFVYASGATVSDPAWYQTNAEAIAIKSEVPPSGTGLNAPPRDGLIWFNSLLGSLFIYDSSTSGWYETGPQRSFAYSPSAPPPSVEGAGWFDTTTNRLKVWDGSNWVDIDIDGGVY